jgi:hypothetical protein
LDDVVARPVGFASLDLSILPVALPYPTVHHGATVLHQIARIEATRVRQEVPLGEAQEFDHFAGLALPNVGKRRSRFSTR